MVSPMTLFRYAALLLALGGTPAATQPATQVSDDAEWLTGPRSQGGGVTWVKRAWISVLGSSGACQDGELWTFRQDGTYLIKRCVGGRTRDSTGMWAVARPRGDQRRITMDGVLKEVDWLRRTERRPRSSRTVTVFVTKIRDVRSRPDQAVTEIELQRKDF